VPKAIRDVCGDWEEEDRPNLHKGAAVFDVRRFERDGKAEHKAFCQTSEECSVTDNANPFQNPPGLYFIGEGDEYASFDVGSVMAVWFEELQPKVHAEELKDLCFKIFMFKMFTLISQSYNLLGKKRPAAYIFFELEDADDLVMIAAPPEKVYLSVPYSEKNAAKKLGAQWDEDKKQWFIFITEDAEPFKKWLSPVILEDRPEKVYLNVPYKEKDDAKKLGARWDAGKKKWYIPGTGDTGPFKKWLSE
jgi:hypothetical protein